MKTIKKKRSIWFFGVLFIDQFFGMMEKEESTIREALKKMGNSLVFDPHSLVNFPFFLLMFWQISRFFLKGLVGGYPPPPCLVKYQTISHFFWRAPLCIMYQHASWMMHGTNFDHPTLIYYNVWCTKYNASCIISHHAS